MHRQDRGTSEVEAARRLVGRTPADRLRWLVRFATGSVEPNAPRQRRTAMQVYAFTLAGTGSLRRSAATALTVREVAGLSSALRGALEALAAGRAWEMPPAAALTRRLVPSVTAPGKRAARRVSPLSAYDGPLPTMALAVAADLLCAEGWRLGRCGHTACEHPLFIRRRPDQDYCSARCQLLEQTRRHRARQSPEAASEERHARYVRKVAREHRLSERRAARMVQRIPRQRQRLPAPLSPSR